MTDGSVKSAQTKKESAMSKKPVGEDVFDKFFVALGCDAIDNRGSKVYSTGRDDEYVLFVTRSFGNFGEAVRIVTEEAGDSSAIIESVTLRDNGTTYVSYGILREAQWIDPELFNDYDGVIANWQGSHQSIFGNIFFDKKQRFENGDFIRATLSRLTAEEIDRPTVVETRNSRYLVLNKIEIS